MKLTDKEQVAFAATLAAVSPKQRRRMRQWLRIQDALEVMTAKCRARAGRGKAS